MSIEQLLQENTQAMRDLTAALNTMRHLVAVAVTAPTVTSQEPETKAQVFTTPEVPAAYAPTAPVTRAEPVANTPEPVANTPEPVANTPTTLADVKPLFIKLAASDRPAAIALLAEFGCAKLTEVKPEQYAAFHARLVA